MPSIVVPEYITFKILNTVAPTYPTPPSFTRSWRYRSRIPSTEILFINFPPASPPRLLKPYQFIIPPCDNLIPILLEFLTKCWRKVNFFSLRAFNNSLNKSSVGLFFQKLIF